MGKVKEKVTVPLNGLKVAPYYGCTLLRPRSVAIEPLDKLSLFSGILEALGATVIDFPASTECCSSYQILSNPDIGIAAVSKIIESAQKRGAEALVTSCPLCEYNQGKRQSDVLKRYNELQELPTFYFTQLIAVALGLGMEVSEFQLNHPGAIPLLKSKNIVGESVS